MTTPHLTPAMQAIAAGGGWPPPPPPGPPVLYSLVPSSGPASGGNTVLIYGQGLYGVTSVTFGGTPATIVSQPPAPGPWPGDGGDNGGGDDWDHGDHRHLMQIAAGGGDWGGGGGGGYGGPLVVLAPPQGTNPSTVPVVVTTGNGTSNSLNYTYTPPTPPPTPTITGVFPNTGPTTGGTFFVILGNYLTNATVTFGSNAATVLATGSNYILGVTPAGPAGPVTVTVTTPGGPAVLPNGFIYSPVPTATGISPSTAAAGTTVLITGTNLGAVQQVLFGSFPATINSNTGTTISVTVPSGYPVGTTVPVSIIWSTGAAIAGNFTYA